VAFTPKGRSIADQSFAATGSLSPADSSKTAPEQMLLVHVSTISGEPANNDVNRGAELRVTTGLFIGVGGGCALLAAIVILCFVLKKLRRDSKFISRSNFSGSEGLWAVQVSIDGPEAGEPFIDNCTYCTRVDEDTQHYRGETVLRLGLLSPLRAANSCTPSALRKCQIKS
jgi:hypothetical protein